LRDLSDRKGQALVEGVLAVVDKYKPLHLSLVGGDPLVRYRELEALVPQLLSRGIHVQIVTSAFRPFTQEWSALKHVNIVVSVDGLAPEHDIRRTPATYERILKNISGQKVTIHCTITAQMMQREGYLDEFLRFWTSQEAVHKVWFSLFTPQIGDDLPEMLSAAERSRAIADMLQLRKCYSKLDMPESMIRKFATPPKSPEECIFARTTRIVSADLRSEVTPCQFGGKPDCEVCGCIASMGLAAVGSHKLGGVIPVGMIYEASLRIGLRRARSHHVAAPEEEAFPILR
jgi:sulfatase maturation enzyme AslB (radical SAM superfamily)